MRAYNPPIIGNLALKEEEYANYQNVEDNEREPAYKKRGWTLTTFILAIFLLYLFWDWVILRNRKVSETISPSNIRTNTYNMLIITFAAVLGINLLKIIFVKLAAWDIPVISWVAEKFVVLFQL